MRSLLVICVATASVACSCGPGAYASSLFEADDEGWTLFGNGEGAKPTFVASGGNPNGHICLTDANTGPDIPYFVAPPRYYGDVSRLYGTRLTFDLKINRPFQLLRGDDVKLNGGGLALIQEFGNSPGLDWTPRLGSVRLDDQSGWKVEETDAPATEENMRAVLRNLTSIRIRGDYADGSNDVACLDNVYFGTP